MVNMRSAEYAPIALAALTATPIPRLLAARRGLVLERIAMGGGETRWYCLERAGDLASLSSLLRPGSRVSVYFDDRIAATRFDDAARARIVGIGARMGDAVVAVQTEGIQLNAAYISGADDLADWLAWIGPVELIFLGEFPPPDNDGVNAVTLQLPDLDGVVRPHPH